MKKIAFFLPNLNQGGAEKVMVTLVNELSREKFKITLVLFEKKGHFLNYLKEDVEVIELKTSRIRYSIFKIIPLIFKMKPDIAFIGWGEIAAFISPMIPFFRKTKFVARETNVVSEHVKRKEIRFFYKFYNHFDKIIAQSDDMKKDLIENFTIRPQKIVKINNPVDVAWIQEKMEEEVQEFSSEFKNVVAIGNLSQRKGFDLLLNVFARLKNEKIKLFILGDGADKEKLLKQKENLNLTNVEFLGNKKNPYPYLAKADLFVLSSRYEGFPNVLLEAGACGTYALTNDCPGGIREIIQEKINGEIMDITQAEEFADKIKDLCDENQDKKLIIKNISSRFSKEIIVESYESLLRSL